MSFRHLVSLLTLGCALIGCTPLDHGDSDGSVSGGDGADAGGTGGMGGMGGVSSGTGGMSGAGAVGGMGNTGGMAATVDCETTDCVADESCIDGPECVPTCSLDDSCEVGQACREDENCPDTCTDDRCRPACTPDCGLTEVCVDDDDCESGYCDRDTDELSGSCRPSCAQTSSCDPGETCTRSRDCTEGTCDGALCHPVCGETKACMPGSACATSADCSGTDLCHATEHVCLTSCVGNHTLAAQADFEAVKNCWEIDGNLVINPVPSLTTIDASVLPYLTDITGSLTLDAIADIDSITLPALSIVAGGFITANNTVGEVHFPNLLELGTFSATGPTVTIGLTFVAIVEMPKLTTIYGDVSIASVPQLTTLDLRSLERVQGNFDLQGSEDKVTIVRLDALETRFDITGEIRLEQLPNIPWSTFAFIDPLNGNETVTNVGCNTESDCNCGNTSCVPPP